MKNIMIAIVTSLLLFGLSAGTSFYINRPLEIDTADENESTAVDVADGDVNFDEPPIKKMEPQLPVAIRPDQSLTIDAVRQMTEAAEKRQMQLEEYEQQLKKEDQRVQILFEDLKREKKELTAYSESLEGKIRSLDEMTVQLQELATKVSKEKAELEALQKKNGIASNESEKMLAKVDTVKGWFSGLEAQQAADILIEKANQGELEFAAALLHSMQDRQKAKILQAINDPTLVNQLIDSLKVKKKGSKK